MGIVSGGGFPRRGFPQYLISCVVFARKSVIARDFLLKIDTAFAIAMPGLRMSLLLQEPPGKPPIRFSLNTVCAKAMTELILERVGPLLFKIFLLESLAFRPTPVICPASLKSTGS